MKFKQGRFFLFSVHARPKCLCSLFCCLILSITFPSGFAQDSLQQSSRSLPGDSSVLERQDAPAEQAYWKPDHFKNIPVAEAIPERAGAVSSFEDVKQRYNSPDFNYSEKALNRLSWWDRLRRRVNEFLESILPDWNISATTLVLRLLALLGICALVFIIYRLVASGKKVFVREQKERTDPASDLIEQNLETTDIRPYLEEALAQKNYTLAVRYLHLINLQALAGKEIIAWDHRKTNHDFLAEIQPELLRAEFEKTNRIYEYVWFGNFTIDEPKFLAYQDLFVQFKNLIG